MGKLIIDGNSVYEVDEECLRQKEQKKERQKEQQEGAAEGTERRAGSGDKNR